MTRRQTVVKNSAGTRYRVVVESDPMPAVGNSSLAFLRHLAGEGVDTGMLACGPLSFQTMNISHDGARWVAVMEAEEETR